MAAAADTRPDPVRIEELFHEASRLPLAEQADYLDRAARGDRRIQEAVAVLLAAAQEAGTDWTFSALELEARHTAFDSNTHASEFFGPYRMVRRIAAGG